MPVSQSGISGTLLSKHQSSCLRVFVASAPLLYGFSLKNLSALYACYLGVITPRTSAETDAMCQLAFSLLRLNA